MTNKKTRHLQVEGKFNHKLIKQVDKIPLQQKGAKHIQQRDNKDPQKLEVLHDSKSVKQIDNKPLLQVDENHCQFNEDPNLQQVDDKPPHMLTNIGLHEASVQIPLMEMARSRACLLVYTDDKPAQFSPTNLTSSPTDVQAFKIISILPLPLSMIQQQLSSCQSPMFPGHNLQS